MKTETVFSLAVAALISLSIIFGADAQTNGRDTVAKERAAGTTSDSGNRCPGGKYDSCVQTVMKGGWNSRQAAAHCTRTCAK